MLVEIEVHDNSRHTDMQNENFLARVEGEKDPSEQIRLYPGHIKFIPITPKELTSLWESDTYNLQTRTTAVVQEEVSATENTSILPETNPQRATIQFLTSALEDNPNVIQQIRGTKGMVKKGLLILAQFYLQNKESLEVADALDLPLSTVEDVKNHLIRQIWELSSLEIKNSHPWRFIKAESQLRDVDRDEMLHHDDEHDYQILLKIEDKVRRGRIDELADEKLIEKISLSGYNDYNFGEDALFVPFERIVHEAGLPYAKSEESKYYTVLEDCGIPVGEIPEAKKNGNRGMKISTHTFVFAANMIDAIGLLKKQTEMPNDSTTPLPYEYTLRFLREAIKEGVSSEMEKNPTFTPEVFRRGMQILEEYFVKGKSTDTIAENFGLSKVTINHLKRNLITHIWEHSSVYLKTCFPLARLQFARHDIERDMKISKGKGGRATRIAELAQEGRSAHEICQELGITTKTMNKYRHILKRWGVELPYVKNPNEARDAFRKELKSEELTDDRVQNLLGSVSDSFFLSNSKGESRFFMPLKELALNAGFRYAGNLAPTFYETLLRFMPVGKVTKEAKSTNQKPLSYLFILDVHAARATEILQNAPELLKYRR